LETTVEKLSELWKTDKQNYVRLSSYTTYLILLERHILPEFADKARLTEGEVQDFVLRMLAGGLSAGTVKETVLVLKMILRYGASLGLCEEPHWRLRYPGSVKNPQVQILPVPDVFRIMDSIRRKPDCKGLGIFIGVYTGLRIGELCGLQWGDIDLRGGVIHVRRTCERIWRSDLTPPRCELVLGPPKTVSSVRDVPLAEELGKLLALFPGKKARNFVLSDGPRPVEPRSYRNYFARLLDSLDIPRVRFHALRHTFATRCIETGGDCKTVSLILGHSDVKTTLNLYVHPGMASRKAVVDGLRG